MYPSGKSFATTLSLCLLATPLPLNMWGLYKFLDYILRHKVVTKLWLIKELQISCFFSNCFATKTICDELFSTISPSSKIVLKTLFVTTLQLFVQLQKMCFLVVNSVGFSMKISKFRLKSKITNRVMGPVRRL